MIGIFYIIENMTNKVIEFLINSIDKKLLEDAWESIPKYSGWTGAKLRLENEEDFEDKDLEKFHKELSIAKKELELLKDFNEE